MLIQLVNGGLVSGWDDPRMPTIAGLRRRGYTPEAIKDFCARVGVAKANSIKETALLEHCLRNDLNVRARRKLAVLHPLRVVIKNYPEGQVEYLDAVNNPEDADAGVRQVPFSRTILVERNDFMEDPPRRFYRLSPGREVRLRYGYFIKCEEVIKNDAGEVLELRCTYDPETRGGSAPDGRKVRATLHWVSEDTAVDAEVRLYDHMFEATDPSDVPEGVDWRDTFNRDSLEVLTGCKVEPSVRDISIEQGVQFERQGYFCLDNDSTPDRLVFNRTVPLRDTWARIQRSG